MNAISMERLFLGKSNTARVSAIRGEESSGDMKKWARTKELDDYESVYDDYTETLGFVNMEFIKALRKVTPVHQPDSYPKNYPKLTIQGGMGGYTVDDFRSHDANHVHDVIRSNSDFRHSNKVKPWHAAQHKRHYDRDTHGAGLGDTRELLTLKKPQNADSIWAPNPYASI